MSVTKNRKRNNRTNKPKSCKEKIDYKYNRKHLLPLSETLVKRYQSCLKQEAKKLKSRK